MENEVKPWHILIFMSLVTVAIFLIYNKPIVITNQVTTNCKNDSLISIIDSLESEIIFQSNGFDHKERRYEDVVNEYQLGLSYLKDYHPKAYQDFHRIIGMKERYSHELEIDNKKRLNTEYE
jgi:hypothetical protein